MILSSLETISSKRLQYSSCAFRRQRYKKIPGYHSKHRLKPGNNVEQSAVFIGRNLFLHTNGTPHQSHNILKLVVAVELELLVDGIAFDEVLFENRVSPFSKSNTLFAFHTIANRCYHLKTEILYHLILSHSLYSTIILGCRKFCDYRFALQFFT